MSSWNTWLRLISVAEHRSQQLWTPQNLQLSIFFCTCARRTLRGGSDQKSRLPSLPPQEMMQWTPPWVLYSKRRLHLVYSSASTGRWSSKWQKRNTKLNTWIRENLTRRHLTRKTGGFFLQQAFCNLLSAKSWKSAIFKSKSWIVTYHDVDKDCGKLQLLGFLLVYWGFLYCNSGQHSPQIEIGLEIGNWFHLSPWVPQFLPAVQKQTLGRLETLNCLWLWVCEWMVCVLWWTGDLFRLQQDSTQNKNKQHLTENKMAWK